MTCSRLNHTFTPFGDSPSNLAISFGGPLDLLLGMALAAVSLGGYCFRFFARYSNRPPLILRCVSATCPFR
jgi:hypothetical protein